jgi:hypothetical protein
MVLEELSHKAARLAGIKKGPSWGPACFWGL